MNSRTLIFMLTVVNLVLAVVVWTNSLWAKSDSVVSQQISTVLRARAIELVDDEVRSDHDSRWNQAVKSCSDYSIREE